jgi:uncharacterized protein YraI
MKPLTTTFTILIFLLLGNVSFGQSRYVNSADGVNLRSGPGTSYSVVSTIPHNAEVRVIRHSGAWTEVEYRGNRGYVSSRYLSEQRTSGSQNNRTSQQQTTSNNRNNSSSGSSATGSSDYTTALGLRGGLTSGITFKHFVAPKGAIELIAGTRWHGFSFTGLYEWHSPNALGIPGLSWEYGFGGQIGFFEGRHYYWQYRNYPRRCNDPNNPRCYEYWKDRSFTAIGLVGIGGLEYKFRDIPFTISLDLIPYFYFQHWAYNFMDGSISVRYVIR